MFAVLNVDTGDFYSESPELKKEAKHAGSSWSNTSLLPAFARRFALYKDALRRSQRLSNKTGCVCAVITLR